MSTLRMHDSESPPGRRKFRGVDPDQRVAQRSEQLLDAGLEAFGTRGFQASGVREICAEAKLTERYFYESFKNREALFIAVHERAAKQIEVLMVEALANAPRNAREIPRAALRAILGTYRDDPRLARVLMIEVLRANVNDTAFVASDAFAQLIEQMTLSRYPNLTALGIDAGLIANGLYGSTIYIAVRWALDGFKEPVEQIVEYCAVFYDSMMHELAQRESVAPPSPRAVGAVSEKRRMPRRKQRAR